MEKTDVSIRLKDVKKVIDGKNVYYFKGNNKETIESLKDNSNLILTFSNDYNRANIQQQVLMQKSKMTYELLKYMMILIWHPRKFLS